METGSEHDIDGIDATPAPLRRAHVRRVPRTAAEIQQRRKRFVTWGLLVVSGVLMINALVGDKGYIDRIRARQDYDALMASLTRVRLENAKLKDDARRLRDEPAAIEEAARRQLGLIRPGETLIILRDAAPGGK